MCVGVKPSGCTRWKVDIKGVGDQCPGSEVDPTRTMYSIPFFVPQAVFFCLVAVAAAAPQSADYFKEPEIRVESSYMKSDNEGNYEHGYVLSNGQKVRTLCNANYMWVIMHGLDWNGV